MKVMLSARWDHWLYYEVNFIIVACFSICPFSYCTRGFNSFITEIKSKRDLKYFDVYFCRFFKITIFRGNSNAGVF